MGAEVGRRTEKRADAGEIDLNTRMDVPYGYILLHTVASVANCVVKGLFLMCYNKITER